MLKATNRTTRRYWNGKEYVAIPFGSTYEPKNEEERLTLLKCLGIVEVGAPEEVAPAPKPKRGRK